MQRAKDRLAVLGGHLGTKDEHGEDEVTVLERQLTLAGLGGTTPEFEFAQNMTVFPQAKHDVLGLDGLLTAEEREVRDRVRAFAEKEIAPVIYPFWERAEFPFELVPGFQRLGIGGGTVKGYGCQGLSMLACAMAGIELARVDGSCSTFYLVHTFLATLTIGLLGSEEQKQELLPGLGNFKTVGCWALTEPSNGSDASALTTTARRVQGGWVLNGRKRWIGNAPWCDVAVIWARNQESSAVNAFIVRCKENPGYSAKKMENKIALRCVQNGDITLKECFVPDSDRIPGVTGFGDTNKVLALSRVMVAWQPVGLAMGAYDMAARYLSQRQQFGAPLASFQLMQEKLQRMLSTVQAMWLMAWRLTKLCEAGTMTHEQASLCKAWTTLRGREVVALGRELLGGNGILAEFLVAKHFCDLEAYFSYEGTYEINALVAGRGATGISAIKPPRRGAVQGWGTPSRAPRSSPSGFVAFDEVQAFLQMAEQAIRVRTQTTEALSKELESARTEQQRVEATSSAAQEESSFLAEEMQGLMNERGSLKEALEKAQREREYLASENALLRQELLDGAALSEESSAVLQLLARQAEDLRASQQRVMQLENENVQLHARVSALERANAAQSTAMLSCLEESERVRLQQLSLGWESPVGPLGAMGTRRSEFTDDSSAGGGRDGGGYALGDAAELASEAGSFHSCLTPLGSATGSGPAGGSIFHSGSADSSPEQQQQQQQQQVAAAAQRQRPPTPNAK
ncbi:Acyl-coenzyme A oxidase peroxisomal [Micractinium conductrix]|uniref:Acyl-coenzyme A oxidase peroxisomal n=1 Tax=Micractinium conductrix TaxID=554055 RepID=A0A2P6VB93_9CHLO|nr:Acyl-coenzyme A oxidase peroxisomal [Micractinium conductrix]|eukprot:PSC71354.1 Acyl-coenzyme A oxidase peroxisomal [Micractinium conductrix]